MFNAALLINRIVYYPFQLPPDELAKGVAAAAMVSQREPDHTLAVRAPPSMSVRTSTTRRHRHGRSHHGGSSYQPQNEFPIFTHTGDVEILVSAGGREQRYLLHRLILAQCSGFFEAGTSEAWSRAQTSAQMQDTGLQRIGESEEAGRELGRPNAPGRDAEGKMRWRYELEGDNRGDDIPMLVQKVALNCSINLFVSL